jgi:hypothetical protein
LDKNFNKNYRLPLKRLYERRILEEEELIYHICQNILGTGKGKERANRKGGRKKTVYLDRANFL